MRKFKVNPCPMILIANTNIYIVQKIENNGEMAQQLRVYTGLEEDPGSDLSTHNRWLQLS